MLFMPCDGGSVDVSELWLGEAQFERLRPLLPDKVRGVAQVDAPACYGPRKTLDNQFARWAAKGIWQEMIVTLAAAGGPPAEILIDRTHIKAHRSASGGKGRAHPGDRDQSGRSQQQAPRTHRRQRSTAPLPVNQPPGCRLPRGRCAAQ